MSKKSKQNERNTKYITEQRLSDKRFRKTETAIVMALTKNPQASVADLVKTAKISRSTFYRHHQNVLTIAEDYECYLVQKFRLRLKTTMRGSQATLKSVYRDALFFILKNRQLFEIMIIQSGEKSFYGVVRAVRPFFERSARLPKNSTKILRIYMSEIAALIFGWYETGMAEDDAEEVLNDIMLLSRTARIRLMPLVR